MHNLKQLIKAKAQFTDLNNPNTSIPVVILGYGNIGQQFIRILKHDKAKIEKLTGQKFHLLAVANSRNFYFNESGLEDEFPQLSKGIERGQLAAKLSRYKDHKLIVIDLSASAEVAKAYHLFAANGWHIISANKISAADGLYARKVHKILKTRNTQWLKNTTVGAALPVQDSIHKLNESGDKIIAVNGIFSGSLSWLFGQYDGSVEFMSLVNQAYRNGYTEPDPRDDLSGNDVYRKACILAQELGFSEYEVDFEPVIPAKYLAGSLEEFWNQSQQINEYMQKQQTAAAQEKNKLCYLAEVRERQIKVKLVAVPHHVAVAQIKPGDNIFIIKSQWYGSNPLVIQGPGAGREVTAGGVLNDLIKLLQTH